MKNNHEVSHIRTNTAIPRCEVIARARRKNLVIAVLAAALIIFTALFIRNAVNVSASESVPVVKCYKSLEIQKGDTLTKISSRYRDDDRQTYDEFIDEVLEINHMTNPDEIHEGCYIVVPYFK